MNIGDCLVVVEVRIARLCKPVPLVPHLSVILAPGVIADRGPCLELADPLDVHSRAPIDHCPTRAAAIPHV